MAFSSSSRASPGARAIVSGVSAISSGASGIASGAVAIAPETSAIVSGATENSAKRAAKRLMALWRTHRDGLFPDVAAVRDGDGMQWPDAS